MWAQGPFLEPQTTRKTDYELRGPCCAGDRVLRARLAGICLANFPTQGFGRNIVALWGPTCGSVFELLFGAPSIVGLFTGPKTGAKIRTQFWALELFVKCDSWRIVGSLADGHDRPSHAACNKATVHLRGPEARSQNFGVFRGPVLGPATAHIGEEGRQFGWREGLVYICPVFPFLTCKQPLARSHFSSCIYPVFSFLTCKQPLVHNHCLAHICPLFPSFDMQATTCTQVLLNTHLPSCFLF